MRREVSGKGSIPYKKKNVPTLLPQGKFSGSAHNLVNWLTSHICISMIMRYPLLFVETNGLFVREK